MSLANRLSHLNITGGNDFKASIGPSVGRQNEATNPWSSTSHSLENSAATVVNELQTTKEQKTPEQSTTANPLFPGNDFSDFNNHKSKLLGVITGKSTPSSQAEKSDTTNSKTGSTEELTETPADENAKQYMLESLLPIIRMEDSEMSTLQLGCDLAALGFDLAPVEEDRLISTNLFSPWAELNTKKTVSQPMFKLPACYKNVNPPPAISKIFQFSDETLFYIFYTMPRDVMQEAAAQELTNRNWRFHKELRVWLTPVPGMKPLQRTPQFERGYYMFFDPIHWKRIKKDFLLMYAALEDRAQSAVHS